MPVVEFKRGVPVIQVECPPEGTKMQDGTGFERSCKGALHLKPGVATVTRDELAFLKQKHPEAHAYVRVIALTKEEASGKPKQKLKVDEPVAAPAPVKHRAIQGKRMSSEDLQRALSSQPEQKQPPPIAREPKKASKSEAPLKEPDKK